MSIPKQIDEKPEPINSSTSEPAHNHSSKVLDEPTVDENIAEVVNMPAENSKLATLPLLSPLSSQVKLQCLENFWPISQAQMTYTWRYLRQPLLDGDEVIDIERTIADAAYRGFYLSPSYRRKPRNHAHLLLLLDQDGSMMPFHPFTRDIVKTATAKKSRLREVETFYFSNVPTDYLYMDDRMLEPVAISKVLKSCSKDSSILIVSDAGATRGYRRRERVDATLEFILQLRELTQRISWLNPMPERRWVNTSASIIAHLVPMFAINPTGFNSAINLLQRI